MRRDESVRPGLHPLSELVAAVAADTLGDAQLVQRFVQERDEAAFAALVRRHGPRVLSACRRVLHHAQDAEDAFQATFLLLARKASAVREREALGSWLHGVALRLAYKIRARRFPSVRSQPARPPQPDPLASMTVAELRQGLDEELLRLPEKYRDPLVLCYLQECTQDEAARQLGWSKGTLRRRLHKGRELLRVRLARRGLTLSAGLLAAALAQGGETVWVPPGLLRGTVGAVRDSISAETALGLAGAGGGEPGASATGVTSKWTIVTVTLVVTGLLGIAAALACRVTPPETPVADAPDSPVSPRVDHFGDDLPPEALARLGTVRLRQLRGTSANAGLAFTADGRLLATLEQEALVHLWDTDTGRERLRLRLPRGPGDPLIPAAVALAPDGGVLAVAVHPGEGIRVTPSYRSVQLWDTTTGRLLRSLSPRPVCAMTFSPDGRTLAGSEGEPYLDMPRLWDVATGAEVAAFSGPARERQRKERSRWTPSERLWRAQLVFAPDGKTLASATEAAGLCLWDVATGRQLSPLPGSVRSIISLAFSPDGQRLAALPIERRYALLWDLDRKEQLPAVPPEGGLSGEARLGAPTLPQRLAFSSDGEAIVFAGVRRIQKVDIRSGTICKEVWYTGRGEAVCHVSPDGRRAVSMHGCGVGLIDLDRGREIRFAGHEDFLDAVACSRTCGLIATSARGPLREDVPGLPRRAEGVLLWDAATGKPIRSLPVGVDRLSTLTFSPTQPLLAGAAPVRRGDPLPRLYVWDATTGQEASRFAGLRASAVAFSPDGQTLACGGLETIGLHDVATGREQKRWPSGPGPVSTLQWSRDGRLIAWCSGHQSENAREVVVGEVDSGREVHRLPIPVPRPLPAVAFAPDGLHLVVAAAGVWVFDLATGKEVVCWPYTGAWSSPPAVLAFSPDGKILAAGPDLWDFPARRRLARIELVPQEKMAAGHHSGISAVAFGPDGRTLITGSHDTTALVWDVSALIRKMKEDVP